MDNSFETFAKSVLKWVPRANGDEWHAIKDELTAHLEDSAQVFEDRGLSQEEAAAQAVARMGDPQTIGQALNAELSVFWGWIGRILAVAIALVVVCSCLPVVMMFITVNGNLQTRFFAEFDDFSSVNSYVLVSEEEKKETFQANGLTVVFHGYRVYERAQEPDCLEIYTSVYANNPFQEVQSQVLYNFLIDGAQLPSSGGGDGHNTRSRYDLEKGTQQVTLQYDQYGVTWETVLAIDWEGVV